MQCCILFKTKTASNRMSKMKMKLMVLASLALLIPSKGFSKCLTGAPVLWVGDAVISSYLVRQDGNIQVNFAAIPGKTGSNMPANGWAFLPSLNCQQSTGCTYRKDQLSAVEQIWQLGTQVNAGTCVSTDASLGTEILYIGPR